MAFYAVILDAGSGGTRAFMYRVTPREGNIAGQVQVIASNNANLATDVGGIHTLQNGQAVGPYLQGIFAAVNEVLLDLPPLPRRLYVLATAGVRDLNANQQQNLSIWVTDHIHTLDFQTREYRAISGTEEGKYGWIAANYSQGLDFTAGYVEMGGASAQIAIPIPHIQVPTARVVARCLNEANMQRVVVAQPGWARANLDAVVRLWAGDVQRADVEGLWGNLVQLAAAERALNLGNQAKLEKVGERWLFSASYRLGVKVGRDKYEAIMFGLIPGRTDQETAEIVDPANPNNFFDPSQRQGYNKVVGLRTITGIQNPPGARPKLARTRYLVDCAARALFPESDQEAATAFDVVVENLDFIGASTFWWSMNQAAPGPLTLNAFALAVRTSSNQTEAQFRAGKAQDLIDKLENNVFKAIWALHVLNMVFGVPPNLEANGRNISFTPYNGAGPDHGRFSWTLGRAVLLASEDLTNLDGVALNGN